MTSTPETEQCGPTQKALDAAAVKLLRDCLWTVRDAVKTWNQRDRDVGRTLREAEEHLYSALGRGSASVLSKREYRTDSPQDQAPAPEP